MIHFERWKIILIICVCLFGISYAMPNLLPQDVRNQLQNTLPSWMPNKVVNLGLDLQGGSHLLFQVELDKAVQDRLETLEGSVRSELRKERIGYTGLGLITNGVTLKVRKIEQAEDARRVIRTLENGLEVNWTESGVIRATLSDQALREIKGQTIEQSIEIVRRRVDETGTKEPTIQKQGEDRILIQLPGVDNPEEIKDLIGTTAKMTFHMVDTEASFGNTTRSPGTRILPMADETGQTVTIKKRSLLSGDMLTNAQPTFQNGFPAVQFQFDAAGSRRFCDITQENIGKPFAIVLDNEVITAPVIQSAICAGVGVITGRFTVQEANNMALLLRAGALPAPLIVMEERTVGPSLGADSVEAGKKASLVALAAVLVFMILAYGLFGIMASLALTVNLTLIFAMLSMLQATLTLPGIAGIVLTVGMAVDANVLIFERIREEMRNGRTPMSAIESGYSQAMSTIIDSNLTTLIAAILLYSFGSGPIKGFAVTLGIGIATSLFSAIMVTRLMVVTWLRKRKPSTLPL